MEIAIVVIMVLLVLSASINSLKKTSQRARGRGRCQSCNSRLKAYRGQYATTCRRCGHEQTWTTPRTGRRGRVPEGERFWSATERKWVYLDAATAARVRDEQAARIARLTTVRPSPPDASGTPQAPEQPLAPRNDPGKTS